MRMACADCGCVVEQGERAAVCGDDRGCCADIPVGNPPARAESGEARFEDVAPVVPVRDQTAALDRYRQLGFEVRAYGQLPTGRQQRPLAWHAVAGTPGRTFG